MADQAVTEKSAYFREEQQRRDLFKWWKSLQESRGRRAELKRYETAENIPLNPVNYRGQRAELRRCETPEEVLPTKAFHRLCREFPQWVNDDDLLTLAIVAGVLAYVEEDEPGSFPGRLGRPLKEGGNQPPFSELRFQQLLASHDHTEFFQRLRRAVRHIGKTADIFHLADGIFRWAKDHTDAFAEKPSRRFRYAWAKDYFQSLPAQGE